MLLTLTYHGADGKRDTVLVECPARPQKVRAYFRHPQVRYAA